MAGMRRSREARPGPYLGMHSQPSQDLQEASEQLHGQHVSRRAETGSFKALSPCSTAPGGDAGTGGELSEGLGVPRTVVLGPCSQPEHPLQAGESRSSHVRLGLRELVGSVPASRSGVRGS